jgi:signal transduction histidine kinase
MAKIKTRSKKARTLRKGKEEVLPKKGEGVQRKPAEGVKRSFQDLQVHQMKLEMQNVAISEIAQRNQVEEALKDSKTRLRQSCQLIRAHEGERRRLSQDLENSILSKLTAIQCVLERKVSQLGKETSPEKLELENLIATAQHAMGDARRIMANLHPSILGNPGVVAGLNLFLGEFQKMHSHVQISNQIRLQEIDVPKHLRVVIFRVLQEALNNFIKHSQGDQVYVSLKKKGDGIKLLIEDNGIGFNPEDSKNGLGLDSMRGRVELSGGIFKIESARGKGTTIRATWPVK